MSKLTLEYLEYLGSFDTPSCILFVLSVYGIPCKHFLFSIQEAYKQHTNLNLTAISQQSATIQTRYIYVTYTIHIRYIYVTYTIYYDTHTEGTVYPHKRNSVFSSYDFSYHFDDAV